MKMTAGQKIFVIAVIAINAAVWAIPSDVVELVARDRQTLLGRFSREHMTWIIGLIPISLIAIYLHLSPNNQVKKTKAIKVTVAVLATLFAAFVADIGLRLTRDYSYELDGLAYHRPKLWSQTGSHQDVPLAARSYPTVAPGYDDVDWTLTTDKRGYRNQTDLPQYDVVVLGDSFAEGSRVPDDVPWPVQLADATGLSVYNLGVSGYAPHHALAALKQHGQDLKPKWVVYLLYEGNDFRKAKPHAKPKSKWSRFFKRSPIIQAIDQVMIDTLGPIRAHNHVPGLEVLSWLPVPVPSIKGPTYYAFAPKQILDHCVRPKQFKMGKHWLRTRTILEDLATQCQALDAQFVIAYAPNKAHVVLPLVRQQLPADKVHAFASLRAKGELPPPAEFLDEFFEVLGSKETVLKEWCAKNQIPFFSLTPTLTQAIATGQQVYYTYDQHWTPTGHQVVADALHQFWTTRLNHDAMAEAP